MLTPHITSLHHPLVKHLVKIRQDNSYRKQENIVLICGIKLITEIARHFPLKMLITSQKYPDIAAEQMVSVTPQILKKITGLQTPEGIASIVPLPPQSELRNCKKLLILNEISDPGNLGTLLRTALALGWEGVFFTEGSADPFNEKAIRAAKGATFHLPLRTGSWKDLSLILQDQQIFVADLEGSLLNTIVRKEKMALILGNEARGVSPEAKKMGTSISIPMTPTMESLNVASAGAILMYLLTQTQSWKDNLNH